MSLNRKIIYIEIDEEVNLIFDRIKKVKEKNIYLVVPSKALIFQSILNLKILKTKVETLGKDLTIVSKDARGRKLCENIDLMAVVSLQENQKDEIKIKINSIEAYRNEEEEKSPELKDSSKVSIAELVGKFSDKIRYKTETLRSDYNSYDFSFKNPGNKGLIGIVLISLALFLFISYVALPGATIYVKPKADVIETGVNIEFADAKINQKSFEADPPYMIKTFPVETVFEKKINFDTISTVFEGSNASGTMKLINHTDQQWTLKSKTRFQTGDGIVFRSLAWVTVPPQKSAEEPGTAFVEIQADEYDSYKQIIGDRGNLPPSKFSIPGLSAYNQKLIWGETEKPTQGGVTKWSKIVQKEDIEAARQKVENDILESAKVDIENYLKSQNEINNSSLLILKDPKYIKKEIVEIRVPEEAIGQKMESIEVYSKIKVTALAYDESKFKQILRSSIMSKVHPDMQLREINYDNVGYDIVSEDQVLKIIKVSATVSGREEYTIDTTTESGLKFVNKIREAVVGMSKDDAENYLTNLKEISQAEISTWPFFSTRLPGLPENIEVKLKEE